MFKPARMTRVLLGGHKQHLDDVIETLHEEGVVHLEDYVDPTGTTSIGTPLEAGDQYSSLLVHVRGLLKALGAEHIRGKRMRPHDPEAILREAESNVKPVLDELHHLRSELAAVTGETGVLAPLVDLDVDLSMLGGLQSIRGYVGTVRQDPRVALDAAGVAYDASLSDHHVALAVAARDAEAAERVLAQSGFTAANVPAGTTGTPRQRIGELTDIGGDLAARIQAAEGRLAALRDEWGPRLAALERHLAQSVDKTQAPLRFAVTETTFHVEGWVPAGKANRVQNALAARYGDSVYFEDLGDAPRGHEEPVRADTGAHPMHASHHEGDDHHGHDVDPKDEAPVKLQNKGLAKPYEFMLGLLGRPRYGELDPTKLMLIFFPLFFGLMVGDVLVGAVIMLVGLLLKTHKVFGIGGPSVGRALMMGGFMAIIAGGFVFGEGLGIHFVVDEHAAAEGEPSWENILGLDIPYEDEPHGFLYKTGHAPAHDAEALHGALDAPLHADPHGEPGTEPLTQTNTTDDNGTVPPAPDAHGDDGHASGGILTPHSAVHLSAGGMVNLGYYSKIHDIQALLVWSIIIGIVHLVLGLVLGVRNVAAGHGITLAIQEKVSWLIILAAVPVAVLAGDNTAMLAGGIGALVVGIVLLWIGTAKVLGVGFVALLEVLGFAGNILSYTRLAAIGASKAGMALAFMAIGFDIFGGGSFHSVAGWIVYLLGMVVITGLAILSGGLQSLRLQFVEFFQKFYTGGGRAYEPFGGRRA